MDSWLWQGWDDRPHYIESSNSQTSHKVTRVIDTGDAANTSVGIAVAIKNL